MAISSRPSSTVPPNPPVHFTRVPLVSHPFARRVNLYTRNAHNNSCHAISSCTYAMETCPMINNKKSLARVCPSREPYTKCKAKAVLDKALLFSWNFWEPLTVLLHRVPAEWVAWWSATMDVCAWSCSPVCLSVTISCCPRTEQPTILRRVYGSVSSIVSISKI